MAKERGDLMRERHIYTYRYARDELGLILSLKRCCIIQLGGLVPFWFMWRDTFGIGWHRDVKSVVYSFAFGIVLVNVEWVR